MKPLVLVTGSSGFIGSHVAQAFYDAGYRVAHYDITEGRDVRRFSRVAFPKPGVFDLVVHCAAAVVTTAAKAAAGAAVAQNLEIDAALFSWAARTRPGRVVYFSSSCAYPAAASGSRLGEDAIDLRHPSWPDGLYGWVKLTGEQFAARLAADGVPVTVVRPFSVYGPGMRPGFAVSGFLGQARVKADPLVIWGDDSQVRDFIHVADVAASVVALAEARTDGPVNLGTGRATSLRDLAVLVAAAAGYLPVFKTDESLPAGMPRLVADIGRLRAVRAPRITLESGLARMAAP